jgi:D-alanine-D-alanine ligase
MTADNTDSPVAATSGTPRRQRLVLVFGGRSAEHDVSCVSARHVLAAACEGDFDLYPVAISRDGQWRRADEVVELLASGPGALPASLPVGGTPASPLELLAPEGGSDVVVFPMLHGPLGEDGTVQGLCELLDVAYVGCGVLSSALCMDKAMAKQVLVAAGIPQARHVEMHRSQRATADLAAIFDHLGNSVFVKPSNMGSSVGVTRADDLTDFTGSVDLAFTYDEWVVIEERISGREIECGVLGAADDPRASVPGEAIPGAPYRHYSDKYLDGITQLLVPANIDADVVARVQDLALKVFAALRCEGMARVDFFLLPDGRLILNEVNTLPGFTPYSMYPTMWAASGVPYPDLVAELVRLAAQRHQGRQRRTDVAR